MQDSFLSVWCVWGVWSVDRYNMDSRTIHHTHTHSPHSPHSHTAQQKDKKRGLGGCNDARHDSMEVASMERQMAGALSSCFFSGITWTWMGQRGNQSHVALTPPISIPDTMASLSLSLSLSHVAVSFSSWLIRQTFILCV